MSQEKAPEISKSEFVEWSNSPVTEFIINELVEKTYEHVLSVRACVRSGEYSQASFHEGYIAGLDTILEIQYEDVESES